MRNWLKRSGGRCYTMNYFTIYNFYLKFERKHDMDSSVFLSNKFGKRFLFGFYWSNDDVSGGFPGSSLPRKVFDSP